MIPYEDHILPMAETPLNKALAALSTRLEGLAAPTRQVWDPWTCPPDFLKALAHAFSVDLWVDDWTETRKRSIIARAVEMHRHKGTLAGIVEYLRYVDADLVGLLVPPMKLFSGPSLTRAEREAWLSSLSQLRVWRVQERGNRKLALHSGGYHFSSFFETSFPKPSTALSRLRRRARWVVDGVETDTRVSEFGSYFRLHLRGEAGNRVFCDDVKAKTFFQPSTAQSRLVTISPTPRLPWRSSVGPRLTPVTAEPERVVVNGKVDHGVFCGRPVRDGYFRPSTAVYRIFNRFAVHDGRRVNRRPSIQFMGTGRYGFPAHTAHLEISKSGKLSRWRAGEGIHLNGTRFWMPHNPAPMANVRRALIAAKRASDQILIRYTKRPQVLVGDPFILGSDNFVIGKPG